MSRHRRSIFRRRATAAAMGLLFLLPAPVMAQTVSNSPVERAITQSALAAIAKAGIDLRTTPVRVITTADRVVYLTGQISNRQTVKTALAAAASAAPGYRVISDISFSGRTTK